MMEIRGPDEFAACVTNGLHTLHGIGLDSYVEALVSQVSAGLPNGVTSVTGRPVAAWTQAPTATGGRAQVALDWPLPLWRDKTQVAAYLAHEATHAYRWSVDQATWADEVAPSTVEFVVRWVLAKLEPCP